MGTRKSVGIVAAQIAAVGGALAALTWFVVTEQRRANPVQPPAPAVHAAAASEATPAVESPPPSVVPTDPAVFLDSSKSLAVDASPSIDEAVFLLGSKSGVIAPIATEPAADEASTTTEPVFLPNSKSRLLDRGLVRPLLTPGTPATPVKPDPRGP